MVPTEKAVDLITKLKNEFKVVLISNNKKKKVSGYCSQLDLDFIFKAYKPIPKIYSKELNEIVEDTFKIHPGTIDQYLSKKASGYSLYNYIDLYFLFYH